MNSGRKILTALLSSFIIVGSVYSQPGLIPYTPDPTVDITPTLQWNSVSGATQYQIQIDDDVSFTTPLVDDVISNATNYTPASPLPNGQTYWRVSSDLDFANYSAVDDFNIKTFPDLHNFAHNPTSDYSPTVAWTAVSSATTYKIQVDDNISFSSPDIETSMSGATTYNIYIPGVDTLGTHTFYWRVATDIDTNAFSPYGTVNYQDVNLTRYDGSIERNPNPVFSWNAYSGAGDYRIQISYDKAFTTPLVDNYTSGATSYNSSGLGTGQKYWRVSTNQDYNSFGRIDSLRISGSPVPVFLNGDTIFSSKPTLSWHPVSGANSYHIQIDTVKTFDMLYWSGNVYTDTSGYLDTTFIPYNKFPDDKYYWRVDTNYSGDYSEIDSFYISDTTTRWYVRLNSTGGDGSKNLPFDKVGKATELMTAGDTLFITEGTYLSDTGYVEPDTLDNVTVLGGWDTAFSIRDSRLYKTIFSDTGYAGPFYMQDSVVLDGITFSNYTGTVLNLDYKKFIKVSNCSFVDNNKAIYVYESQDIKIENNLFISNSNGIHLYAYNVNDSIKTSIRNNTFVFQDSCAIKNDSLGVDARNNIFAFNSIAYQSKGGKLDTIAYNSFWGNDTTVVKKSMFDTLIIQTITDLESDTSFISQFNGFFDPLFLDTTIATLDLHLGFGSACFDAGDPSSPYVLEPNPNGGRINLGAYGGTQWASVAGIAPTITSISPSDTIYLGDTLIMSVTASGTTPLNYQWQKDNVNIAGATSASYIIYGADLSDIANYRAIVTNAFGSDTSTALSLLVVDNIPPDPVTGFTLSEVNCSTVSVLWTQSTSGDAVDVMIRASVLSMPTHKDSGEYSQLVSKPVSALSLTSLPCYGAKVFISSFVKDSAGNWSTYVATASDTITLSDGLAPANDINVVLANSGDTAMVLTMDVVDSTAEIDGGVIINISTDSSHIRYNTQDTLPFADTSYIIKINTQGLYYVTWAPFDAAGNLGTKLNNTFTLANSIPVFTFSDHDTIQEDSMWILENFVKDYNQDPVTVTLSGAPDGMTLDNTSNKISWTPKNEDVGNYIVILTATDSVDGIATDTLNLTVLNTNDAPMFVSLAFPDTSYEDSVMVGYVYIVDVDKNDSMSVYLSGSDWLELKFHELSGDTFTYMAIGTPAQKDTGIIIVELKVYDKGLMKDTTKASVYIVNTNDPPVLEVKSRITSNGAVKYVFSATDDFDVSFTYYGWFLTSAGDTLNDTVYSNSDGVFEIYPLLDGSYSPSVSVTDQHGLSTKITDTLTIENVNSMVWAVNTEWDMVSIPTAHFTIDSSINNEIVQYWDESKPIKNIYQYYNRVTDPLSMNATSSYWLKNVNSNINVSIDTSSFINDTSAKQSTTIKLAKDSYGWNMISSPYVYPVSWNSDLTLWEWDNKTGEYIDAQNVLYPWKGYWVLAEATTDSVVIDPKPVYSSRRRRGRERTKFSSKDNWTYNLVMESEAGNDKENLFGFNKNASNGKDRMDRAEPPRINGAPYIFFSNPQWTGKIKEYASDIRKDWSGTEVFNIGVSSGETKDKPLSLRIEGRGNDDGIYLFIRQGEEIKEYQAGDVISIKPFARDQYITLFASADKNLLSKIPLTFRAAYPYPNPFKGLANIKYTLPYRWQSNGLMISDPYKVKIKLYDIKGRVVKELLNDKQGIGTHRVVWDGKVAQGRSASSGAYFVKITAGSFTTVKKIMVLK